ncbi:hypothetical protein MKK55_25335 [Methylobacterium sp. J-059]|uniref:hypothetical protein n=1 Tax=Methylobacterium sp. J-059 TaxID=2836643 RepID=UPI001FBAA739|nr:hypothetical protein [Methylobacterium sp. J-059]MCJ2042252.1 hypothetical protein [Methylobacterium sp. J-059]
MPIHTRRRIPSRFAIACAASALGLGCLVGAGSADTRTSLRMAFVGASTDLAQRFAPADAAARVALGPGGADVRVAGDLMDGVALRVEALLAANPQARRIHLTSGGGLVEEGLALGALIAEHGLDTYVPDECASACTLAFVRGRARYLGTAGRLGFHAPYEAGLFGQTFAVDASPERAAYRDAGIAADFTAEALAVASDDIWMPDAERLIRAGAVTEVVEPDRFPDSTLDDDDGPEAARAQVLRNLPILAQADPAALDRIAAWYRDGYRNGRSEADAFDGLRARANDHLKVLFRRADDATIRALGHAALAASRAVGAGDGDACEAIAGGDVVAIDEALRHAAHPVPSLPALIVQARRQNAVPTEGAAAGDDARPRRHARRPPARCAARIAALRQALDRPAREAAAEVRGLLLTEAPQVAAIAAP